MALKRAKADAVIIGLGWAGSLMANELTQAGLNVVAIERGAWRDTGSDFPTTMVTDELRYATRRELLQPLAVETMTFRNTGSEVMKVNLAPDRKMATGVTYVDKSGREWEQPADIVVISAYQMDNVRLMLLSGIGKPYDRAKLEGVVGRNYANQTISGAGVFFENEILNPFVGAGALAQSLDNFNSDDFEHAALDFIGGANMLIHSTNGGPIGRRPRVPPGTLRWGSAWKQAYKDSYQTANSVYNQGNSYPHEDVFLDLDPTYTDRFGRPLLRVTFDWNENDKRSAHFMADRAVELAHAMNAKVVVRNEPTAKPFSPTDNLSSHTTGGAIMGDDPKTSAVNRYLLKSPGPLVAL